MEGTSVPATLPATANSILKFPWAFCFGALIRKHRPSYAVLVKVQTRWSRNFDRVDRSNSPP